MPRYNIRFDFMPTTPDLPRVGGIAGVEIEAATLEDAISDAKAVLAANWRALFNRATVAKAEELEEMELPANVRRLLRQLGINPDEQEPQPSRKETIN